MNMVVDETTVEESNKLPGFFLDEAVQLAESFGLSTAVDDIVMPSLLS